MSLLDLFENRRQLIVYRTFHEQAFWLAGSRLPRVFDGGRPRRTSRTFERSQHESRIRLPSTTARHRAREGPDGMGPYPLVHDH